MITEIRFDFPCPTAPVMIALWRWFNSSPIVISTSLSPHLPTQKDRPSTDDSAHILFKSCISANVTTGSLAYRTRSINSSQFWMIFSADRKLTFVERLLPTNSTVCPETSNTDMFGARSSTVSSMTFPLLPERLIYVVEMIRNEKPYTGPTRIKVASCARTSFLSIPISSERTTRVYPSTARFVILRNSSRESARP